ncbi:hypothetical protein GCM10022213_12930 [Parerythrobacter jejuensis]
MLAPIALIASGCGGDDSPAPPPVQGPTPNPSPTPTPTPTPTTSVRFEPVIGAIEAYQDNDFAVLVGDGSGTIFTYTKGVFQLDQQRAIASASKWLTATTIMRLVDQGLLSLADNPQTYLTYWTSDAMDDRSRVTLEQLLSFTSGFNARPGSLGCVNTGASALQNCVRSIYDDGLDAVPGDTYSYGPEHMQIAAAMAEVATGKAYGDIFVEQISIPLGLSNASRFVSPSLTNPLASGGAASTAEDYALFLTKLLADEIVADRATLLADRTNSVAIEFRPQGASEFGDWHYALGAFVECDNPSFDADCADDRIYSSPGSFGWTPWIDLENGYWGLIARRGERNTARVAVELEQQLQPLIVAALAN